MQQIKLFKRAVNIEWILLLAIVVVGVFLRVLAQSHLRVISPDGVAYSYNALNVLEGRGYFERRGPLFQLLLIISYKIFGVSFGSSVLVPQFFGSIIPILLFFLGKHFFDSKTGLVAAILGSLNPMLINLSCWVLRETLSLALILIMISTAYSTLGIRSKKRTLIASVLTGFLSGLIILTREEMIFVIPPSYIAYIYFYEKKRLDFIVKTGIFLAITVLTISPWLLYSLACFGNPLYGYVFYIKPATSSITDATPGISVFQKLLQAVIFGLWKEMTELPAIFSFLGFTFLLTGIIFTIRKRAVWIIYFIMALDLFILSSYMFVWNFYSLKMPYQLHDASRLIFSAVMPANVIIAYGIRRLIPFLSEIER